jgi:hypothetical protein
MRHGGGFPAVQVCSTWRRPRRRCGRGLSSSRPISPRSPTVTDGVELVVPVTVTDRSGTEMVHADITTWVTPVG